MVLQGKRPEIISGAHEMLPEIQVLGFHNAQTWSPSACRRNGTGRTRGVSIVVPVVVPASPTRGILTNGERT